MSKERFIVWSNLDLNLEDWRADLEAEYPDASEDDLVRKMYEINDSYIDDERINLAINTGTEIIAIADIGRWDGRYMGYSEIKSGKLSDCLYSPNDYSEWFVDKDKEFRCTDVHHDGRNHVLYRKFKENATEDEIEHLKDLIYDGRVTQEDIDAVTEPLGETVLQVYGWTFDPPVHIPIKGRPVGRIEYLGCDGKVGESIEYDDEERMIDDILDDNYYGTPMTVVLYRDETGKTIDQSFVEKLDPPIHGLEVTDIPPDIRRIKERTNEMNDTPKRFFTIDDGYGNKVRLAPVLGLYQVQDFMGQPLPGLAILLNEYSEEGELLGPYADLTKSFGEFIGMKNCVYIDTNNCPFAEQILKEIGTNTGFTHRSGFCVYPAWVIKEDFLREVNEKTYEEYSDAYDEYMSSIYGVDDIEDDEPEEIGGMGGMGGML